MPDYEDTIVDPESRHQPEHELEEVEPIHKHSERMAPDVPSENHPY